MSAKSLGDIIYDARKLASLSLRELSERVGVNHVYISDIEHDRRSPSERVLKKLSKILGLNFDELMAMAGRFGKRGDEYIKKHPTMGMIVRQVAENDLNDEQLKKLLQSAKRLGKRT